METILQKLEALGLPGRTPDILTALVLGLGAAAALVCILALGGCDPQVRAHVGGNLAVGNGRETLIAAICQCLPYIGFPRTLNALAAVNELTK